MKKEYRTFWKYKHTKKFSSSKFKQLLVNKNITLEDLAEKTHLAKRTLSEYTKYNDWPGVVVLHILTEYLECTCDDFCE